jgi:hypothetical protein
MQLLSYRNNSAALRNSLMGLQIASHHHRRNIPRSPRPPAGRPARKQVKAEANRPQTEAFRDPRESRLVDLEYKTLKKGIIVI